MRKPKRSDDKYWTGTKKFNHIQYESDLEDYIIDLEAESEQCILANVMAMLPTDEDIKEMMTTSHFHYEKGRYRKVRLDRIQGAKIVRDLIKKRLQGN